MNCDACKGELKAGARLHATAEVGGIIYWHLHFCFPCYKKLIGPVRKIREEDLVEDGQSFLPTAKSESSLAMDGIPEYMFCQKEKKPASSFGFTHGTGKFVLAKTDMIKLKDSFPSGGEYTREKLSAASISLCRAGEVLEIGKIGYRVMVVNSRGVTFNMFSKDLIFLD